jgi:NDP-sugar pyrophosphorylase family protein
MRYLIPIAADNTLFPKEEFHFPKPLIEINGIPMIGCVVENIQSRDPQAQFIFVVQKRDCVEFSLDAALMLLGGDTARVVQLEQPTMGAVCSALMAIDFIEDDEPLVICNGDQLIEADLGGIGRYFVGKGYEAGVVTFSSIHPRWSYVKKGERGEVLETAEKRVLSRSAIAGYYYFKSGKTFIDAAKGYLQKADPIQGRYFLSPCMNEIILSGGKVGYYDVPTEAYWSFYSPQRIEFYQNSNRITKARRRADDPRAPTQVVIPMAGLGSRFSAAGYSKPKPFIDVKGATMIERVMDNLRLENGRFVLIALQSHLDAEPQVKAALEGRPDLTFAPIDFVTEGAACTVLTARSHLDPEAPLLIANCDQIVDFECEAFVEDAVARGLDGSILVFKNKERDPKWSFAKLNAAGMVTEVKEKVAISDDATVGLYYFRRAGDFIAAATDMIVRNDRVNNEFYVCPVYNYAIRTGAKVGVYYVEPDAMHGIGTPDDLNAYLELI